MAFGRDLEPTRLLLRPSQVITRRNVLALAGMAALTGCGGPSGGAAGPPLGSSPLRAIDLVSSDRARSAATPQARSAAVTAVTAFSADLFAALARSGDTNLACSPYSVATALGMTVQGATGTTATQMLTTLHSDDATDLADGLNTISLALAARSRTLPAPDGSPPTRIELATANALFGQRGVQWKQPFLDVLARDFGTGMRVVDYRTAAEAARAAINAWVSGQTRARIPELLPAGAVDADTRLALVNALYLKAPWAFPFEPRLTRTAPFHRLDGSTVSAHLMESSDGTHFASGPGWVAAELPYAGAELAMTVVVPEAGRFAEVQKSVTGPWLTRLLTGMRTAPVRIVLPRWTMRTQVGLNDVLAGLGMPIAFTGQADFSGMTGQLSLMISAVQHETFIAVDEKGTEAAAATAVTMMESSASIATPQPVIADRPFLYVIHDRPTGTPLFIGRVLDPSGG